MSPQRLLGLVLAASLALPVACTTRTHRPTTATSTAKSTTTAPAKTTTSTTVGGVAGRPGPGAPTPQPPTLGLTRMGIFGGGFPGQTGEATLASITASLGEPDRVYQHPAVECRDYDGNMNVHPDRAQSARWGDLTVTFNTGGTMMAYIYGPAGAGHPAATYQGKPGTDPVTLGTPLSTLLADPAAFVPDAPAGPYGQMWRVRGQAPGLAGFTTGPTPADTVTRIFVGSVAACFGLT